MADESGRNIGRIVSICRDLSVLVGLGLIAAGCGDTSIVSNEAAAPPPTTVATTTTTTVPPTTTTTIDFNRPVDQGDGPLPASALFSEVAEVLNDMRGQTDDVHEQMLRLTDFPKLASPYGAQILDLSVTLTPDGSMTITESSVVFRVPNDSLNMVDYFDAELVSRSWNVSDEDKEQTEHGERVRTVYRWPGTSGDDKELAVTVEPKPGLVLITIENRSLVRNRDDGFTVFQGWQDDIRTPGSAEIVSASVSTAEDTAILSVRYELDAASPAEARSDMLSLVRSSEFETEAEAGDDEVSPVTLTNVETGDVTTLTFGETNDDETVEMVVRASFPLEPID